MSVCCNDDQITPLLHSWMLRTEARSSCLLDGPLQGSRGPLSLVTVTAKQFLGRQGASAPTSHFTLGTLNLF